MFGNLYREQMLCILIVCLKYGGELVLLVDN